MTTIALHCGDGRAVLVTAPQLACLRYLVECDGDGTGRAEWRIEYAERRYVRDGNDTDAAFRLRAATADRIVNALVTRGLVDGATWGLTPDGHAALADAVGLCRNCDGIGSRYCAACGGTGKRSAPPADTNGGRS